MARKVRRGGRGEARWQGIIREQLRSGRSVREFCRKCKLAESTFYFWRRVLARRVEEPSKRSSRAARAAFVPVRMAEEVSAGSVGRMEILLSGGHRVQVTPPVDGPALAAVLAVLENLASGAGGREARPC